MPEIKRIIVSEIDPRTGKVTINKIIENPIVEQVHPSIWERLLIWLKRKPNSDQFIIIKGGITKIKK